MKNPTGWTPMDAAAWPFIADVIPKPWPREAVAFDLRWWAERERTGTGRMPGRPALCARWGWKDGYRVRSLMRDEAAWADPMHGGPANERPAAGQRAASFRPHARTS